MLALDVPIVPEHVWEPHVARLRQVQQRHQFPVVGDGPFVLTGYQKDQYITLNANPNFWRGKPGFDELVFKYYKDTDAEVEALKKGEVDFVYGLTPAQYDSLKRPSDITTNDAPGRRFYALAINPGAHHEGRPGVRRRQPGAAEPEGPPGAVVAIDPKTLVDKIFRGHGTVGERLHPAAVRRLLLGSGRRPAAYAYDPAKADQLLDAAGYKKGSNGMRHGPDGKPLTLRLLGETNRRRRHENAAYLKEWSRPSASAPPPRWWTRTTSATPRPPASTTWPSTADSVNPDPDYVLSIHTCAELPAARGRAGRRRLRLRQALRRAVRAAVRRIRHGQARGREADGADALLDTVHQCPVVPERAGGVPLRPDRLLGQAAAAGGHIWGQDGYWAAGRPSPRPDGGGGAPVAESESAPPAPAWSSASWRPRSWSLGGGVFLLAAPRRTGAEERE